jgi:Phospholipid methyltransferase
LIAVGVGFIGLARYQLGRSFSVKTEAHELVTAGLYSKIRNPIYVLGMVMITGMITGMILILQRPGGLAPPGCRGGRSDHPRPPGSAGSGSGVWGCLPGVPP